MKAVPSTFPDPLPANRPTNLARRAIELEGIVQGVGFRPFVYRLATTLGLSGFVRNQAGMVYLEVEGPLERVDRFTQLITRGGPPLARIDAFRCVPLALLHSADFYIVQSESVPGLQACVPPDIATCNECLHELFDPADRRYRYPFVNCTNCGPRLTIIQGSPYDRERTTMSKFAMCSNCRQEYQDPNDRRFDAQPIACPRCGPQLKLLGNSGVFIDSIDPVRDFAAALRLGKIGAIKSLGGYHLVCDAGFETTVAELRRRKHRDQKPFAVMVSDVEQARELCDVDQMERDLLCSAARPIVLLRRRGSGRDARNNPISPSVSPDNPNLGLMLPSAPLQHLLMHEMAGRPLVMTSGNRSDEPIAYEDLDAIERLGGIVDLFLTHNRPISVRCDDSVARVIGGQIAPIRRARGYAPASIALPHALPCPTLAVGGQLKSTFALGVGGNAFVSQHLGDLDHFAAYQAFERDVHLYENLIGIRPQLLVHDLHPDYASTRYAQARATRDGLRILPVQHHHAHIASGMAEHGLTGSVIGVAFDGTGYGTDGAIWGGEFLIADYKGFQRAAHLRYVGLPGADAAVRAPWRSALAYVLDADLETLPTGESALSLFAEIPADDFRTVRQMILRRFNSPLTSSMGRLFDAIAALAGIRTHVSYEGQAAIELEWLATGLEPLATYAFGITPANTEVSADVTGPQWIIDTRPLIRDVVQDVLQKQEPSHVARRFHSTVVEIVATVCERLRREWKLHRVVLSGGVFMNALLTAETTQRLVQDGFEVYSQQLVPANDGGLSLGQLAIAAASVEYAARVH